MEKHFQLKHLQLAYKKSPQLHVHHGHFIIWHMETAHEALQEVPGMFLM